MGKMIEIRKDEYDRNIVLVPLSDYVAIKRYRIDEAPCYKDYDYKYFLFIEKFDDVERTVLSGELVDYISALEAEVERLKAKNVELRERLEKAVELPCKIGDTVYGIGFTDCDDRTETDPKIKKKIFNTCLIMGGHCEKCKYGHMAIEEFVCTHIQIGENGIMGSNVLVVGEKNENYHSENVFTTREAAEVRLAELKGEEKNG